MANENFILWQRLDISGFDVCRIASTDGTWRVEGTSCFVENSVPARLNYLVVCDEKWHSLSAEISGWAADKAIDMKLERKVDRSWLVNGKPAPNLTGLIDLDLGFTPATNTIAIKRLGLDISRRAESVAVWLDTADWTIKPLSQSYLRVADNKYAYESPDHGYKASLSTDAFGFVIDYPQLWCRI